MLDFGFYNMDCMEGMKEFPDQFFDLAIVDPPYGINVGQSSMDAGGGVAPHRNRSAANLRGGQNNKSAHQAVAIRHTSHLAVRRNKMTNNSELRGGYNEYQSEVQSRSEIMVGGGLLSRPKFTRHSMTATHRMPNISKNCQEWQRKQSYGAGTIFSTISVLLSV